jgi:hypothetical protein
MAVAAVAMVAQVAVIKKLWPEGKNYLNKFGNQVTKEFENGSTDTFINVRATVPVIAEPTWRKAPCCPYVIAVDKGCIKSAELSAGPGRH